MNQHTPGPWEIVTAETEFCSILRPQTIRSKCWGRSAQMADYRGVIICDFEEAHGNRPHSFPECEANAALIIAAPDLLAAAKLAEDRLSRSSTAKDWPALDALRAAITKAEGQK